MAALLGGLVFVALLTTWHVRSVLRSPHPGLPAAETLALTVPLILVLFAPSYQTLAATDASAFTGPLNRTDTLYFVVTVLTTVGFGEISPVKDAARVLTTVQMIGERGDAGVFRSIEPAWNDRNPPRAPVSSPRARVLAHIRAFTGAPVHRTKACPSPAALSCTSAARGSLRSFPTSRGRRRDGIPGSHAGQQSMPRRPRSFSRRRPGP